MKKVLSHIIAVLIVLVIVLGTGLGVFLVPFFQADHMLAQILVDDVVSDGCYLVSLELIPDNDESKRKAVLKREPICGDFLGLGYEFALPDKTFALFKKPGIVITNLVAFEERNYNQTGNIRVGSYEIEFVEFFRVRIGKLLQKTPAIKSLTYDIKALKQKPQKGAVISYKLEPYRQQVIVECTGCEE